MTGQSGTEEAPLFHGLAGHLASPALKFLQGETGFFEFQVQLLLGLTRLRPPVVGQGAGLASLMTPAPAGIGGPVGPEDLGSEVDVRDVWHFTFLLGSGGNPKESNLLPPISLRSFGDS